MAPTAESLVTNAAAIATVVAALGSSVGLAAILFVGLYVAAALPFFFDDDVAGDTETRLPYFTTATAVGFFVGAVAGQLIASFVEIVPGILTWTPWRMSASAASGGGGGAATSGDTGTLVRRIPFALVAILGVIAIVAGASALASDEEVVSTQTAVVALVIGALAVLGGGAGVVLVARDYATAYYSLAAAVVAGAPAATYDWLATETRLAAAAVAILVALAAIGLCAGVGWYVERHFSRHLATSAQRYGTFWLLVFIVMTVIYLVAAGTADASAAAADDPAEAANVARALFVAFWVLVALGACAFGALICMRAGGRTSSGRTKRAVDSEASDAIARNGGGGRAPNTLLPSTSGVPPRPRRSFGRNW